jgi:sporulation protein YlmC with PRC-barrel domain
MTIRQSLLSMTAAAALLALPAYAQQGGSSGGGSSMQTTTTQTSPQQGPLSGSPGARAGTESGGATGATVRGGNAGSPMGGAASDRQVPPHMQSQGHAQTQGGQAGAPQGRDASGGVMAQTTTPGAPSSPRDGTPGNPPSTAVGRAVDRAQGQTPQPDGTPGNPPGTAAGRAVDRTLGTGSVTGPAAPDGTPGNPPGTAAGRAMDRTLGTNTTGVNPGGASSVAPGTTAATIGAGAAMVPMDSAALRSGRRASKVIGSNIYNENNESIGEVDDIIIPQGGGGAPVAVISVGGFLGIGSKLVAVPYERLQMNTERNRWTLSGATKDSLNGLPTFSYDAAAGERRG